MAEFDYDIGIIGGGAAGLTVASGAAQLGARTLLLEQESSLGGDCLHYGCVPSKTLIKSAKVFHLMKDTEIYGLPKVNPGIVDFSNVATRIKSVIDHIQLHDSVERFSRLGVDVKFGQSHFIDKFTVQVEDKKYSASKWVIGTGSSSFIPDISGLKETGYLTNREIFSLSKLPEKLIVIGGGPIGMEMAQAFCRLGSAVEVIQRSDQILSKEDKDIADIVMQNCIKEGVRFHLNTTVAKVWQEGGKKHLLLTDKKGRQQTITGSDILVAVGRTPNIDNLGLENIDVATNKFGLVVDKRLRTSQKHIYGAGDVNGGYQFTHSAGYDGGVVLTNAILKIPRKVNYSLMPWCTYTAPEIASIGMNEKQAQSAGIAYKVKFENFINNDRAYAEKETLGKIKLILNNRNKPLGVQIVGSTAGDILSQWITIMNSNVKLSNVAGAIQPYPTYTEINKRVVGGIYSEKLFSPKVRKVLKLLFKYRG